MASEKKKQLVASIVKNLQSSPVIGLLDLENLPAQQLQKMRSTLRAKGVNVVMTRKRLLQMAMKGANKSHLDQLESAMRGVPALLLAKDNPFALYAMIQKSKSEASAKAGQIAPRDIMVKAGPTSFAPGPIISELAAVGIKTKVEAGKLAIIADTVIVKEGNVISAKVAETLKRLDIKPMEIGLNIVVVWENGFVFKAKDLAIDEQEYAQNVTTAAQWAMNLAVECAYATKDTAEVLLQKAFREAKAVALESAFLTPETVDLLLAKSEREALSIKKEASL